MKYRKISSRVFKKTVISRSAGFHWFCCLHKSYDPFHWGISRQSRVTFQALDPLYWGCLYQFYWLVPSGTEVPPTFCTPGTGPTWWTGLQALDPPYGGCLYPFLFWWVPSGARPRPKGIEEPPTYTAVVERLQALYPLSGQGALVPF